MLTDARIETRAKLDILARALRNLGDRELSRELYRGLNRATEPLKSAAKAEAGRRLPQRGGLAGRVSGSRLSTRRRGGVRNPGVSVVAAGMPQLANMDAGFVRHPVYGHDRWVTQAITPGWFSDPMEDGRDEAAQAVETALDVVAAMVAARVSG